MFPLPYGHVASFASNLATCLSAGIDLRTAIRTGSTSMSRSTGAAWQEVVAEMDRGTTLSEALRAIRHRLPPFFVPVVAVGELTGRLDESLRFLAIHCQMLARPVAALRNAWLAPLSVYLGGQVLGTIVQLLFGSWSGLMTSLEETIIAIGSFAAVAVVIVASPLRIVVDRIKLVIPLLGSTERELAAVRFFHIFAMLYATGGMRVEKMIRHAALAVPNHYLRGEFSRAANEIARGHSLSAAFATSAAMTTPEKDTLAAGEVAGRVTEACERIAGLAAESLETRMKMITPILVRMTLGLVTFSLAGSILPLIARLAMR